MHEACHVPVISLDLAVHAQLLDSTRLSGFSQSQSSDSQKHKFYFNPFRDSDITRESLQFYCFSNWLPVTEKVPTGEKSFALLLLLPECRPASRALSVHRFSTLVPIVARFRYITSPRLRRNAGTSRSSCSKFATIAFRMESSETASLDGCAIATGMGSGTNT